MRVLHVIPSFFPAHFYGGPPQSVYALCRHLSRLGCQVTVLTTDANGKKTVLDVDRGRHVTLEDGVRVRYCRRHLAHTVSVELLSLLNQSIECADLVHLTGVYSFPTLPGLALTKLHGKPLVWSPRGSLNEFRGRRRVFLKRMWDGVCRLVEPGSLFMHATSEEEAAFCRRRFPGSSVAVIPNGVEVPAKAVSRTACSGRPMRILYLGRHDPTKAIENLLLACERLESAHAGFDWTLTITGRDDGEYSTRLRDIVRRLGLAGKAVLAGEVIGEAKERLLESADLLVLPSHSENFGMAVAEALARGVPVIASRGTPWKAVTEVGCGLWVDNSPEALCAAIHQMSRMPLLQMGERGRLWVQEVYSWPKVAQSMFELYRTAVSERGSLRFEPLRESA